ncbi:Hypothetical protein MCYN_0032 [Mycoplasmopsis cynos C142]|uniref:Uncharacterized protein n=1 Tax=Mycoplasmopsis cynos (strain C142) TaxID=1246955 RepID=L0RU83_MYCC1|nr:Hypothetical protein MCYN_0032 [Mycoplasmopsis cynos C142]
MLRINPQHNNTNEIPSADLFFKVLMICAINGNAVHELAKIVNIVKNVLDDSKYPSLFAAYSEIHHINKLKNTIHKPKIIVILAMGFIFLSKIIKSVNVNAIIPTKRVLPIMLIIMLGSVFFSIVITATNIAPPV